MGIGGSWVGIDGWILVNFGFIGENWVGGLMIYR